MEKIISMLPAIIVSIIYLMVMASIAIYTYQRISQDEQNEKGLRRASCNSDIDPTILIIVLIIEATLVYTVIMWGLSELKHEYEYKYVQVSNVDISNIQDEIVNCIQEDSGKIKGCIVRK